MVNVKWFLLICLISNPLCCTEVYICWPDIRSGDPCELISEPEKEIPSIVYEPSDSETDDLILSIIH